MEDFSMKHLLYAFAAVIFGAGAIWSIYQNGGTAISFIEQKTGIEAPKIQASLGNFFRSNQTPTLTYDPIPETRTAKKVEKLSILIGGDVMFDRKVRALALKNGYESLLAPISSLFSKADIAIVNLEGPVTSFPSKTLRPDGSTTKELVFTFSPASLPALKDAGVDIVSLANNHTDNFGQGGFLETKKNLASTGIQFFGDPWNSASTSLTVEKNGIKVAFVGYHAFQRGFDRVLASISELSSQGYFVIVMPHWGEEYKFDPSENMRNQARLMASAGASAIIGAHSHIIGDHEWLDGIPIYYSLGNLLFDQYFSPEVMKGLVVELELSKSLDVVRLDSVRTFETSTASRSRVDLIEPPKEQ